MATAAKQDKKKAGKEVSTAAAWKQSSQGVDLEVPSGNVCKARPVGMQVFLERGMIPNSLMPIVRQALKGEEPEIKMDDINEEQITEMMALFDAVTVYCVVEPKVHRVPRYTDKDAEEGRCQQDQVGTSVPIEERDGGKLFVDEVDFEDKQFIFQWVVGGTRDLERFREEQGAGMEHLRAGTGMESKAK